MTVCKQPVATLALNATSSYVVMIREWGRGRYAKKKRTFKVRFFVYKKLFLLVLRSQRFNCFSDVLAIFKVLWRKLVPVLVIDFLPEFF